MKLLQYCSAGVPHSFVALPLFFLSFSAGRYIYIYIYIYMCCIGPSIIKIESTGILLRPPFYQHKFPGGTSFAIVIH
jgi:hypothetical protein